MFIICLIKNAFPYMQVLGFTPTVQTFGTLYIYGYYYMFIKKSRNDVTKIDRFMFIIAIIGRILDF
jgi:hypothetical protein